MEKKIIGKSVNGAPIYVYEFLFSSAFSSGPTPSRGRTAGTNLFAVIVGGVHGDERQSVDFVNELIKKIKKEPLKQVVALVPLLNPDGYKNNTRTNANGIDINRNFPSSDQGWSESRGIYKGGEGLSEPETQVLYKYVKENKPALIVAVHQPLDLIDYDGPVKKNVLNNLSKALEIKIKKLGGGPGSMGGCFGQDLKIPVITLELKKHISEEEIKQKVDGFYNWLSK